MNIFWNSKGSTCYKHLKQHVPECRAVKTFLSSRLIIMNSRRLWNSHQGTSSWGPWHLATFWNLESRKWHFQGFSRVILHHRGCHVVSSEHAQDWEQCRRKISQESQADFSQARCLNVPQIMSIKTGKQMLYYALQFPFPLQRGFAWSRHRILPNSQFQKREYKYH